MKPPKETAHPPTTVSAHRETATATLQVGLPEVNWQVDVIVLLRDIAERLNEVVDLLEGIESAALNIKSHMP